MSLVFFSFFIGAKAEDGDGRQPENARERPDLNGDRVDDPPTDSPTFAQNNKEIIHPNSLIKKKRKLGTAPRTSEQITR